MKKGAAVGVSISMMLLLLFSSSLFSVGKKEDKKTASKGQPVFRVPVDVVLVKATVTDKDGKPVTDLSAKDFHVYEDGKPQEIQTFALEAYGPSSPEPGEALPPVASPARLALERNAAKPRMISIVIDDLTMESVVNFPHMIEAIRQYVREEMTPGDQVAILSASGRVQVPFSDSKQRLLDELETIPDRLNLSPITRSTTDYEACAKGKDPLQCILIRSQIRRTMEMLRQHIRVLRRFEGARSVVLFSDGLLSDPGTSWSEAPETYRLQEVIDRALRSGIVINTLSSRGISPYGQKGAWKDAGNVVTDWELGRGGLWRMDDEVNRALKEDTMSRIAYETGGAFSRSRNDLHLGLQEIVRRRSYSYVLSYVVPAHKPDGAYHRIRVEVTRPGLTLSYRKGYYAQKEELQYENSKREDIIEALNAPGDLKQIPMTLSYNVSQGDDATYAVSFVTKANIRRLEFLEEESRRRNMVSLVLAAFDENDRFVDGLDKSIEFRLMEENYRELCDRGLVSRVELKLPMGRYKVKAIVRENNQGKMGSINEVVEIP